MASNFAGSSPSFENSRATRTAGFDSSTERFNDPRLTPLESSILIEYLRLRQNLDNLAKSFGDLATAPSSNISDGLRTLERKTTLVCTALKSSVYGIVLQQQIEGLDVGDESRSDDNDNTTQIRRM